jgi:hypothetical protein
MKALVLAATLLALAPCVFSQCDSTITESVDTPRTIRAKMACFANENAKLEQENTKLKQDLAASQNRATSISASIRTRSVNDIPIDTCKTRAINVVGKRGGVVIGQGDSWMDFRIGTTAVKVACAIDNVAFVVAAGPETNDINDLPTLLINEIFTNAH